MNSPLGPWPFIRRFRPQNVQARPLPSRALRLRFTLNPERLVPPHKSLGRLARSIRLLRPAVELRIDHRALDLQDDETKAVCIWARHVALALPRNARERFQVMLPGRSDRVLGLIVLSTTPELSARIVSYCSGKPWFPSARILVERTHLTIVVLGKQSTTGQ